MRVVHGLVRGIVVLVSVAAGAALFSGRALAFSGTGLGTVDDPYKITSCTELQDMSSDLTAHYILGGDIDCTGGPIAPIGNAGTPFTGTFDGKGNAISHVTTSGLDDIGLFGSAQNATITDVRLEDFTMNGGNNVGALVGITNSVTISYISGHTLSVSGSGNNVGGLVGQLGGSTIAKSFAEDIDITGLSNYTGGLVGYGVGPTTVFDSYAAGQILAASTAGGVVGQIGPGPSYAERLYADIVWLGSGSQAVGAVGSGGSESSNFMANGSFIGTSTQSPLDGWDFTNIWYVRPGKYPGLRPHTLPIRLCNAPSGTANSITVSCTSEPLLEGDPHWELKYGFHDDSTRTILTTQAGQAFNVTVPGLLPGTQYDLEFRYVDATGTSPWGRVEAGTTGSSDSDGDNLTNEEEFKAPNNGDADNDGIPDYLEANVTSFKSFISNDYVTVKTPCTDNFNTQIGRESSSPADSAFDYPAGLIKFVIRGCTPGATVPVSIYFYGNYNANNYLARKYINGAYTTIPGAVFSSVTIGGKSALKLTYNVTDGGSLDADGIVDGTISDPVGIAPKPISAAAVTVPNTGLTPATHNAIFLIASGIASLVLAAYISSRQRQS